MWMDQLRDHTGKKPQYWLVLKEVMRNARSAQRPVSFSFGVRVGVGIGMDGTCNL
jgi:hypothetical protein